MNKILILSPWFGGKWPVWINHHIESCKYNPTIDWIFYTDCKLPENQCDNVSFINFTIPEFCLFVSDKIKLNINFSDPYKICDIRPLSGHIFEDYSKEYDYVGYADIDIIYGDIRKFLDDKILSYDFISFHKRGISNHFCLFKNVDYITKAYQECDIWKDKIKNKKWTSFDYRIWNRIIKNKKNIYFKEHYSTHYKNYKWEDGSFIWPKEWYWEKGKLTNCKSPMKDFLHFHFMIWKGGKWGELNQGKNSGQWENISNLIKVKYNDPNGFKITKKGFFKKCI